MSEAPTRRKFLQEKEAFHNAIISVPFFLSPVPTKLVAVSRDHPALVHSTYQDKLHFNGSRFIKTRVFSFPSVDEAARFYQACQTAVVKPSEGREWAEYCREPGKLEGVLQQEGRAFVPWLESREVRELVNEVSQMVVYHGLFMEEHLRRTNSPLLRFLDHKTLSLEHIYYRWRVYAYLQNDGDKRYRSDPFSIVHGGLQWIPPLQSTIQRGILNHRQRKYFSQLVGRLSRRKQDIEQAMVFAISRLDCAVEVVIIIALEIFERIAEDFIPHFHLISDILFNTTSPDYRRLFARIIPFAVHQLGREGKDGKEGKLRGELKSLIQLWSLKFIFDENYTQGLLFLLGTGESTPRSNANGIHERLKAIGCMEDDEEGEYELEKLCFSNGIPLLENDREESTRLINECLWLHAKAQERPPEVNENYDGEPITEKDLFKIKNKQVKVVTSEGLSVNMLLEKNWQTKGRQAQSGSVDHEQ